jgi:hypothetical protein
MYSISSEAALSAWRRLFDWLLATSGVPRDVIDTAYPVVPLDFGCWGGVWLSYFIDDG